MSGPYHNRLESGGADSFPQPFSKSLIHNVLGEYAVLVSQVPPTTSDHLNNL